MWMQGMLQLRYSNLTAVQDVICGNSDVFEDFGIEKQGPVPTLHSDLVNFPRSTVELSVEEETAIQQAVDAIPPGENGVTFYIGALQAFEGIQGM